MRYLKHKTRASFYCMSDTKVIDRKNMAVKQKFLLAQKTIL